ncbi:ABC transporter permease [Metabacillus malikii]|uniref:ABC-2 type transport system permease protein n=1 Tax=Metabacillus malikii TaxID=1504265 RepID=A0ABT9ZAV4_9BACI|nr:ABC transporter permease [Metabacillus malikii]MDQ0229069.1 ABC-2 type transport system permease protein [Metabacillus malikii]
MKLSAIIKKDVKILFKDKAALVVLFLLPLMFITVMSFALMPVFNADGGNVVKVLVVDQDKTTQSKQFIKDINKVEGIKAVTEIDKKTLDLKESKQYITNGKYPLLIEIPKGFETNVVKNEKVTLNVFEDPAQANTNSVITKAVEGVSREFSIQFLVSIMVDNQVKNIQTMVDEEIDTIQTDLNSEIQTELDKIKEQSGIDIAIPAVANEEENLDYDGIKDDLVTEAGNALNEPAIQTKSETVSGGNESKKPDSFQQSVPGYTVMFAFFIVLFASRSFITERNEGTFKRILAAPVSKGSLFVGKMIPNFIIGLVQVFSMLLFGRFVFGVSLGDSLLGLILISVAMVFVSSSLGMFVASFVKTEAQVVGLSMMIVLTLAALGGTMVPLFIMPEFMQKIALITPHAWALTGYQDLLVRGQGLADISLNIIVLLCIGLVLTTLSIFRMKFD